MLEALHCIKQRAVLCCAALPIPHTEIPKQSCAAFATSSASAREREREAVRERGGGVSGERETACYSPKMIFSPQRFFALSLFRFQTEPQYK